MSVNTAFSTPAPKIPQATFLGFAWGGVVVTAVFVAFRAWVRLHSFKRFYWDDAFVLISWLFLLATAILWQCISKYMYQALYVASGESFVIPPTFIEDSQTYLRGMLAIIFFFQAGLWSVKISFLLFFRRLGDNVSGQKIHWWVAFAFTLACWFAGIGTVQYHCLTPSFIEIAENCSTPASVNFERITLCTYCAMDVLSDLAILSIPIRMLWGVRIRLQQKLALAAIFCLVFVTMAISIIRFAVVLGSSYQPEQSWLYFWNIIEFIIAILIVCLASFRALFAKQSRKVKIPDSGDSRKGLLHGSRSGLKVFRFWSPSWISRSGRSTGSSGSKTKEKSNYSNGPKISQEQIMPLNRVYIRNEFETSSEARPRDWVV